MTIRVPLLLTQDLEKNYLVGPKKFGLNEDSVEVFIHLPKITIEIKEFENFCRKLVGLKLSLPKILSISADFFLSSFVIRLTYCPESV